MTLSAAAYAGLEEAVNRYLALDPDVEAQMAQLHGRVIAIELLGLKQTLYMIPGPGRLQILTASEEEPDCRLRGTPLAIARLGSEDGRSGQLFSDEVEISGDTELAHHLARILGGMEIDWERRLSNYTGEVAAHELAQLFRGGHHWGEHIITTLQGDLRECLQEGLQLFPQREEVNAFLSEADALHDRVERLQARVKHLKNGPSTVKNNPAEGASK